MDMHRLMQFERQRNKSWASYLFTKGKLLKFFWLNLGTFLIALGVYFFKFPNHFNTGGVSGLGIVLSHWFPAYSPAILMFILNMSLLVTGYLVFGRGFGFMTAYSSVMMSVFIWFFEQIYPMTAPLTQQPLLELIFSVLVPGFGAAILFNIQASNGGTDVLGMIMKKYTSLNIGTALAIADFLITILSFVTFGPTVGLYSILGLLIRATVTDYVIESLNLHKYYTIITAHSPEVLAFITQNLHRSATITHAEGAFTGEQKVIIMTVLKRSQGVMLQHFIREVDPKAFLFITNTSEIIGKGFGGT